MRFKLRKQTRFMRVFAWLPHYLQDADEVAWLEPVYRTIEDTAGGPMYLYYSIGIVDKP